MTYEHLAHNTAVDSKAVSFALHPISHPDSIASFLSVTAVQPLSCSCTICTQNPSQMYVPLCTHGLALLSCPGHEGQVLLEEMRWEHVRHSCQSGGVQARHLQKQQHACSSYCLTAARARWCYLATNHAALLTVPQLDGRFTAASKVHDLGSPVWGQFLMGAN